MKGTLNSYQSFTLSAFELDYGDQDVRVLLRLSGTVPAMAKDAFCSVRGQWATLIGLDAGEQAFETGIVNGGSGTNADTRSVYPGRGYWLYMTEPGNLCAIGM